MEKKKVIKPKPKPKSTIKEKPKIKVKPKPKTVKEKLTRWLGRARV